MKRSQRLFEMKVLNMAAKGCRTSLDSFSASVSAGHKANAKANSCTYNKHTFTTGATHTHHCTRFQAKTDI